MTFVRRFLIVGALFLLPVTGYAQEATLTGTVTDSTGAVLPGVTVTAVNEATGNTFTAATDERGIYRIPVRVGAYQVTAELQGFTTVARTGLQVLVGQTASVNLQMAPSTVQETVTVTAEAPLLNVSVQPDQHTLGTTESQRANYLLPTSGQYRTMQFGFRLTF